MIKFFIKKINRDLRLKGITFFKDNYYAFIFDERDPDDILLWIRGRDYRECVKQFESSVFEMVARSSIPVKEQFSSSYFSRHEFTNLNRK
jgi:hypothetical protein